MSAWAALKWLRLGCWLALLVGTGCLGCARQTGEPPRPSSVPVDAIWVGGPDGGVFLRLEEGPTGTSTYRGRVYADSSGDIIFQGLLTMVPENHARINIDDPTIFSGWDGENLYLTDGALLKVVREEAPLSR